MAVASAALVFSMAGTAVAAGYAVSSNSQIGPNTISGHQPPNGTHANVITGSINTADVADGSLLARDIKAGEIKPSGVITLERQISQNLQTNHRVITFHDVVPGSYLLDVETNIAAYSADKGPGTRVSICTLDEYSRADGGRVATLDARNVAFPTATSAVSATSTSLESTFTATQRVDVGLNCSVDAGPAPWAANSRLTLVPLQSQGTYPATN
jgi:hypothetical protein